MSASHTTITPDPKAQKRYAALLEIYKPIYRDNAASFAALADFAGQRP